MSQMLQFIRLYLEKVYANRYILPVKVAIYRILFFFQFLKLIFGSQKNFMAKISEELFTVHFDHGFIFYRLVGKMTAPHTGFQELPSNFRQPKFRLKLASI